MDAVPPTAAVGAPAPAVTASGSDEVAAPRRRRTQAERRAATRGALLDAAIDVLVEEGYARLTGTAVCARAGVTRGAQAHYFATKADLVVDALRHLTERLVAELVSRPLRTGENPREQYALLLDRLWDIFSGPVSAAQLELFVAARTDAELRAHLRRFEGEVQATLEVAARRVAGDLVERGDFKLVTVTGIATIRGLVMQTAVHDWRQVRHLWPAARDQILDGLR